MALAELSGARSRPNADPVIVLLTDGRPDDTALAAALSSAATARRAGVTVFAIGLGSDVQREVLSGIAGDPARVFLAPEAADLAAIYGEVARVIPCR
jgi:collagen type VI alpha